jgi:hypothetical protein
MFRERQRRGRRQVGRCADYDRVEDVDDRHFTMIGMLDGEPDDAAPVSRRGRRPNGYPLQVGAPPASSGLAICGPGA